MNLKLILCCFLSISVLQAVAQQKSKIKFGKITADDFKQKLYDIDSSANAVVIAEIGSTEIVGNSKGSFSLEFKRFRRAHILNKNGYDIADVEIRIFTNGTQEEELKNLKAVTYNLENGRVIETKLDTRSAVFKDKISKHLVIKKFTFPAIREGSIIEFEYTLASDFLTNLQPWQFQGYYPHLWSEYNVSMPEFYDYVTLTQGYQRFHIQDRKDRRENFTITDNNGTGATDHSSFSAGVSDFRWVMKDVPAIKEESYTSTIRNHVSRIEFQLSELREPYIPKKIMESWEKVCKQLLESEDFGYSLTRDNGWLNDVMAEAAGNETGSLQMARNIYAYVRNNMTCTNYNRVELEKSLKNVLKSRNGSEAEINLLLTAMLLKAGLAANPVLLSTRTHGYTYPLYPLMDRFNYVICRLEVDGKYYYLDASRPTLGFGRLHNNNYNGHARVVNQHATPVEFIADSLVESELCSVFIINDEKGNLVGSVNDQPGYYQSLHLRDRIKDEGKDQFFAGIKKSFNADIEILEPAIDSLDKYDHPIRIRYKFNFQNGGEDILYFNPMFGEGWKENPFKSATRSYPVEMPYALDEVYLLKLDIPKGYILDELPKQLVVKLNEQDDGFFEYRISESNGTISLRSRIKLRRAFFLPDEYEMLREFFNLVVKKHGEQIVFRKKN